MTTPHLIEPLEARIAPAFAAIFDLSSLNGANGFKLSGVAESDFSGHSVSDAGDVNGDGFDDLIIGAWNADPNGASSGASYVVFGKAGGFAANLDLASLDGSNGFKLTGVAEYDRSGDSVSAAGDINGDGFDDLIIGAYFADANGANAGAGYVVFGKASGFAATLNLSTLNGSNGFKLSGVAAEDRAGGSVSGAGDVNGDGFDDVIVGAPLASPNGQSSGASYVIFGKATGFAANLDLSTLDGSNGFKLSGVAAGDVSGGSVSAAGDVNGDGFGDLIIGAQGAYTRDFNDRVRSGAGYVIFGKASGFAANLNLSELDGSNGFKLSGVAELDRSGWSVSAAGDVDGDGFDDVIIGAFAASSYSGESYVVFGKASGFAANMDLASLDGSNGFKLSGVAAGDQSGRSVSAAGDVNGDGFGDVIIGAFGADGGFSGASYVVFGKASGFAADLNLSALDGANGFKLRAAVAGEQSGFRVSTAGDVNGDGVGDLIIGAPGSGPNGVQFSGASYVVFGRGPATLPAISIGNATAAEGDAGISALAFPVTLSSASTETITVQFSTVDGTASGGSDYTARMKQTLEFAPGETAKMIMVTVNGDTTVEPDETFLINLWNPTNATIADAEGVGTILNDDEVQVVISRSGDRASFTDVDGDLVTVKTSRGAFVQGNFVFGSHGELAAIDLGAAGLSAFGGAKISALATAAGGGDGLVNIGAFKAPGINLNKVTIDGDLGEIDIGAGVAGKMTLKSLKAKSIGVGSPAAPGAESTFAGKVGALKIAHDVKGVLNITGGAPEGVSIASDVVKKVVIGGNLEGGAGGAAAGLLAASGGIRSIVVKGSVIGGAEQSGIAVDGKLGSVKIGGDLRSAGAAHPVTISALGDLAARKSKEAVAIAKLTVGGSVLNAEVLAGYWRDGTSFNPDASVGSIKVAGNWSASSVAAGVADATGDGFGRNDALIAGDTTLRLFARIASVVINGTATGSEGSTSDYFGISAQQIGRFVAGNARPAFTAGPDDILIDAVNGDFRLVDFGLSR